MLAQGLDNNWQYPSVALHNHKICGHSGLNFRIFCHISSCCLGFTSASVTLHSVHGYSVTNLVSNIRTVAPVYLKPTEKPMALWRWSKIHWPGPQYMIPHRPILCIRNILIILKLISPVELTAGRKVQSNLASFNFEKCLFSAFDISSGVTGSNFSKVWVFVTFVLRKKWLIYSI